jgi:hypothetical protein
LLGSTLVEKFCFSFIQENWGGKPLEKFHLLFQILYRILFGCLPPYFPEEMNTKVPLTLQELKHYFPSTGGEEVRVLKETYWSYVLL